MNVVYAFNNKESEVSYIVNNLKGIGNYSLLYPVDYSFYVDNLLINSKFSPLNNYKVILGFEAFFECEEVVVCSNDILTTSKAHLFKNKKFKIIKIDYSYHFVNLFRKHLVKYADLNLINLGNYYLCNNLINYSENKLKLRNKDKKKKLFSFLKDNNLSKQIYKNIVFNSQGLSLKINYYLFNDECLVLFKEKENYYEDEFINLYLAFLDNIIDLNRLGGFYLYDEKNINGLTNANSSILNLFSIFNDGNNEKYISNLSLNKSDNLINKNSSNVFRISDFNISKEFLLRLIERFEKEIRIYNHNFSCENCILNDFCVFKYESSLSRLERFKLL